MLFKVPFRDESFLVPLKGFSSFVIILQSIYGIEEWNSSFRILMDVYPIRSEDEYTQVSNHLEKMKVTPVVKLIVPLRWFYQSSTGDVEMKEPSLSFSTGEGFSHDFVTLALQKFSKHLPKQNRSKYMPYFRDGDRLLPLHHVNIFKYDEWCIVFSKGKGYSEFKLSEFDGQIELQNDLAAPSLFPTMEAALSRYALSHENEVSLELPASLVPKDEDLEAMVDLTFRYLELLRSVISKVREQSESNRRLIINIFLMVSCGLAKRTMKTEYTYSHEDFAPEPIGSGPLDYVIDDLEETIPPQQTTEPRKRSKFVDAGALITNVDDDVEEEVILDELDGKASFYEEPSILEAKKLSLSTVVGLRLSLGQLVAQMMDSLKLKWQRKRNRTEFSSIGSATEVEPEGRIVKGILSTGQHSLFFVLYQEKKGEKPILTFVGRFSVKVFDQETGRSSGLKAGQDLDRNDVKRYILNLYTFLIRDPLSFITTASGK